MEIAAAHLPAPAVRRDFDVRVGIQARLRDHGDVELEAGGVRAVRETVESPFELLEKRRVVRLQCDRNVADLDDDPGPG